MAVNTTSQAPVLHDGETDVDDRRRQELAAVTTARVNLTQSRWHWRPSLNSTEQYYTGKIQLKTAKQNYPDSVASYDTRQKTRLAYSTTLPSSHSTWSVVAFNIAVHMVMNQLPC